MIKVVSWNIAKRDESWHALLEMDADVALLQETGIVPGNVQAGPGEPWLNHLYDRWPLVVKLSDRVKVEWFRQTGPISDTKGNEMAVSGIGTIASARIVPLEAVEPFIAVSMYGRWLNPHPSTGSAWIYSNASAHRIISDVSAFIGQENPLKHRILAAGDLNILLGYGEHGNPYWAARYQSVFDRMDALGLSFVGPQAPDGRQAHPWPRELPPSSRNVPTYHSIHQKPATATRQLDYVFASRGFSDSVRVRAMNEVEEWGPSDHCRIEILVS